LTEVRPSVDELGHHQYAPPATVAVKARPKISKSRKAVPPWPVCFFTTTPLRGQLNPKSLEGVYTCRGLDSWCSPSVAVASVRLEGPASEMYHYYCGFHADILACMHGDNVE